MSVIQLFPRRRNPMPPESGTAAPAAAPAMTFEQFAERESFRIWNLMFADDRRDVTFNDVARELWEGM